MVTNPFYPFLLISGPDLMLKPISQGHFWICAPLVEGADTVLRGSVRASEGFFEGKPEVLQPRVCPRKIPREPSH